MAIDLNKLQKKNEPKSQQQKGNIFNKDLSFSKRITAKQKEIFYKDFSMLLNSGIDFKSAFGILIDQQKNDHFKNTLQEVINKVIKGVGLSDALKETGQFTLYECFSVKIGEETKRLEKVLLELHKFFKRKVKMRKQMISVTTYPIFILVITIGVLYFMLTYVVPMFKSIFKQFGSDLPLITQKILFLSEKAPIIFVSLLLLIGFIFFLNVSFGKLDAVRRFKSKLILGIPFVGRLLKAIHLGQFCQFLDLLLSAKTPLTDSLDLVKKTSRFYPIESSLESVKRDVTQGMLFANALSKYSIYEYKLISMIRVAEEINELDSMFARLALEYEEEVEHKSKMLGVVLEPVIIIFVGIMVGIIMVAMYAPMFDLSNGINK